MSSAPITPKFQAKAPVIMRDLMAVLPLSDEDAAAILGSFGTETGGFMLREEAGGGGGYGWAQWTGSRRDDMEVWCAANGYEPYAESEQEYDDACFNFFQHEIAETWEKRVLTTGGTISGVFYPPLKDCSDLADKTLSFWKLYERPGTPHADWREEMAHEALRLYRGGELEEEQAMQYSKIAISSGHSTKCQGAVGPAPWGLNEVAEATRVADGIAEELRRRAVKVAVFHDTISTTQAANLKAITDWHNKQDRELDVSVHFNANGGYGTEVLYVTQEDLARELSAAIAKAGHFTDRGPKYRDDLAFLNGTAMPAVLLEICFVDHQGDCDLYREEFAVICEAVADVLGGPMEQDLIPPEPIEPPVVPEVASIAIDIVSDVPVRVAVSVNGEPV